jgi:8-oxo-dGTP pyrophosphatase MutT (NUDIX family)
MSISTPIPQTEGKTEASIASAIPAGQVAALCWRLHKGQPQVLLVTSRDSGRWVLPKGWPMPGRGPEAAAAREAWEEAGVEGKVSPTAIGCYAYDKVLRNTHKLSCAVEVFPLRVQSLKGSFPERKERRRKWFSATEASHLVAEAELRNLLGRLADEPDLLAPAIRAKRTKVTT